MKIIWPEGCTSNWFESVFMIKKVKNSAMDICY